MPWGIMLRPASSYFTATLLKFKPSLRFSHSHTLSQETGQVKCKRSTHRIVPFVVAVGGSFTCSPCLPAIWPTEIHQKCIYRVDKFACSVAPVGAGQGRAGQVSELWSGHTLLSFHLKYHSKPHCNLVAAAGKSFSPDTDSVVIITSTLKDFSFAHTFYDFSRVPCESAAAALGA